MAKCFGEPPFTLERKDIPILSGMRAAWADDTNPFGHIIELIEQYEGIDVWAEYNKCGVLNDQYKQWEYKSELKGDQTDKDKAADMAQYLYNAFVESCPDKMEWLK